MRLECPYFSDFWLKRWRDFFLAQEVAFFPGGVMSFFFGPKRLRDFFWPGRVRDFYFGQRGCVIFFVPERLLDFL